jgi:hypothetical protein
VTANGSVQARVVKWSGRKVSQQGNPKRHQRASQRRRLGALARCPLLPVRPEGANHQWRKIPPGELSIDLVADERLGWVTGRAGAS